MTSPAVHSDLKRIDQRVIPNDPSEIRLVGAVRNEILRLPYFLQYYRQLGVKRFFFADNDSSDGTTAFMLAQPDCHVFYTEGNYLAAHCGVDWQNSLLDAYGDGHWIVLADADECLVYPGSETRKLPDFTAWLDKQGYAGISTLLLDMYANQPLASINYQPGENFLNTAAYFDRDYTWVRRLGFPDREPIGGPRTRLCFPSQNTPQLLPRLWIRMKMRGARWLKKLGFHCKVEQCAPYVFKVPLVKWQRGYAFVTSHRLNRIPLAPVTGALLHFKYFQDFAARVQDVVDRKCHPGEYQSYAQYLVKNSTFSMAYSGSTRYENTQQLVRLGLIED